MWSGELSQSICLDIIYLNSYLDLEGELPWSLDTWTVLTLHGKHVSLVLDVKCDIPKWQMPCIEFE